MQRSLEPELLDSLPPSHPDALQNRRDLRRTNAVMGNHRWIVRTVSQLAQSDDRVIEIGAGTGELAAKLEHRGVPTDGLDLWPIPEGWPPDRVWHRADIRSFHEWSRYSIAVGNLIFHQFSDAELAELGARLQTLRAIVACEPARRRSSQVAFRLVAPLFGANYVSLHDAHVSIAAGFLGEELSRRLGLDRSQWRVQCRVTALGAYRMVATRCP